MNPLKKMIVIFSLIIVAIISLNVGSKVYNNFQKKSNTEKLIAYLKANSYNKVEDQSFYTKIENGLSQEEYIDSEETIKNSDVYTYSDEFKTFSHQTSSTHDMLETDYFFEFNITDNFINSYYSFTSLNDDKVTFIKGEYKVGSKEFKCTKMNDELSKEKEGCAYLKNGSLTLQNTLNDIVTKSKTKLKYLK